ncbi:MAG: hypothetical protein JWL77_2508 [Chthonomonadaceae bacterium]|nr:hypothetical protein [Chthonomonadaceae bacterium]
MEHQVWLEQCAARLQVLRLQGEEAGVALVQGLDGALALLTARETRLVFAGHFKAGKSTLLNAALGRPLLPTYSLPETGAACLLRAGDQDEAVLLTGNTRQTLPCTTEAIENAIALLSATGERRAAISGIEGIEIRLANSPLPADVCWIDTPGINDSLAMDARAMASARAGDVLLWVLNSKQFLSEVEAGFLADHVAANGPGSVVLFLNIFLEQDDLPTWQAYRQRQIPRLCAKVAEVAPEIGFPPSCPPPIVPVSARAVGNMGRDIGQATGADSDFGAAEMRTLLSQLASPNHGRVRHSRCLRAAAVLRTLASNVKARCAPEQTRFDKAQTAWKKQNRKRETQNRAYANAVAESVEACLAGLETELETLRVSLTAGLAAHAHETPDATNQRLNAVLNALADAQAETLLATIADALRKTNCGPLKKAQQDQVRKMLAIKPVCIDVAAAQIDQGDVLASAGVGAVAAGIIPGLGHLVGGLIGAGVGYFKARGEAEHRHTALMAAQIGEAVAEIVEALPARRKALSAYLIKWGRPRQPVPEAPDATPLQTLSALRADMQQIADEMALRAEQALLEI